jgi:hypothetical protein
VTPDYGMPVHPACDLFPMMASDSLSALCKDIRSNGLANAIVVHEGRVVDGRNRLLACRETGVEPRFVEWRQAYQGQMPLTRWIWSVNAKRRHMTAEQVTAVEVALTAWEEQEAARMRQAETQQLQRNGKGQFVPAVADSPQPEETKGRVRVKIAKKIGVSEHKVRQALAVQAADPELLKQVAHGTLALREAQRQIVSKEIQKPSQATTAAPSGGTGKRQQMIESAAKRRMIAILSQTRGLCRGLSEFNMGALRNTSAAAEMETWAAIARESAKQLRTFASELAGKRSVTQ